jgi:uncharacterized membrane protein YjdF
MNKCMPGLEASPAGRRIAWGLAAVAVLANIAGYALGLYIRYGWFDRVLHPATILALTYWLAVFALRRVLMDARQHRLLLAFVIACVGVAIGAWWEVAEWGYDQFVSGNVIKGKHDTIMDLMTDTAGALGAALMSLRVLRPVHEDQNAA